MQQGLGCSLTAFFCGRAPRWNALIKAVFCGALPANTALTRFSLRYSCYAMAGK
ncbi:hypothetical protein KCP69_25555 [Salmonella enterica subsp. enterica]|nr:hypothetical protein KCP69_25555 [Salmonella enterica subsp. enterica]